ncbi:MAG: FABP family protein [Candidatus Dormibacteria bacterium]
MSPPTDTAELVAPFIPWLGRWEGEGRGLWVADPPFRYREELAIAAVPERALLHLTERTSSLASGELSHSETGFLRLLPEHLVELVLAIPAGYVEVHTGELRDGVLEFVPYRIAASPGARPLRLVRRRLELKGNSLRSVIEIAVDEGPTRPHSESRLQRLAPEG